MSGPGWAPASRSGGRRTAAVAAAVALVAAIATAGTLVDASQPTATPSRSTAVGQTAAVCTRPDNPPDGTSSTTVAAVSVRTEETDGGTLTARPLSLEKPVLTVREPGQAAQAQNPKKSLVLEADGSLAGGGAGAVVTATTGGTEAGLSAAPCLAPGTDQWFPGVSTVAGSRTELVLTNPDEGQAEVDLRFFGRRGRIAVQGSPGVVVAARSARTVSLTGLVKSDGPFTVEVHATTGRVAAVAHRVRQDKFAAAGVDWQLPTATPGLVSVVPGVPEGTGERTLTLVNPGSARASAHIQVLGLQGGFTPTGLETVTVPSESSIEVVLAPSLATQAAAVKVTSDQPVAAAVVSTSRQAGKTQDLAVQAGTLPLVRNGVSAVATTTAADAELVLSNSSDVDTQVSFEVFSYAGVSLRQDSVLLTGGTTATRRLINDSPSYVVVTVPDRSAVVGGVMFTRTDGDADDLATLPLVSPDRSGVIPAPQLDPRVGR